MQSVQPRAHWHIDLTLTTSTTVMHLSYVIFLRNTFLTFAFGVHLMPSRFKILSKINIKWTGAARVTQSSSASSSSKRNRTHKSIESSHHSSTQHERSSLGHLKAAAVGLTRTIFRPPTGIRHYKWTRRMSVARNENRKQKPNRWISISPSTCCASCLELRGNRSDRAMHFWRTEKPEEHWSHREWFPIKPYSFHGTNWLASYYMPLNDLLKRSPNILYISFPHSVDWHWLHTMYTHWCWKRQTRCGPSPHFDALTGNALPPYGSS